MHWSKLILCVLVAVLGVLIAQSHYDAQCMTLGYYGAHLTIDGVFCKRQMGRAIVIYKTLDELIEDRARFELKQIERGEWING